MLFIVLFPCITFSFSCLLSFISFSIFQSSSLCPSFPPSFTMLHFSPTVLPLPFTIFHSSLAFFFPFLLYSFHPHYFYVSFRPLSLSLIPSSSSPSLPSIPHYSPRRIAVTSPFINIFLTHYLCYCSAFINLLFSPFVLVFLPQGLPWTVVTAVWRSVQGFSVKGWGWKS